jgi:hypothetical protein
VRKESNHEEERQMVSVPECLKALLADLVMSRGIHEHHDEQHEMTSDASRLGVVDLQSSLLPEF